MKVVHVMPTEVLSEQISVQRVADRTGAEKLRANVFTVAEGSMMRHAHREQEELYVVLDGTGQMDVDGSLYKLAERDALAVPAGVAHQFSNVGIGPLTFLVVAAPAVQGDAVFD
jgi:mannose-6-phosphate isomerase-like protein (cupin superfamily)